MARKDKDPANARPEDVLIEALIQATGRTAKAVYEFDEFRLDVADERLSRGGVPIPLAPKEFETLRFLVERHGRLVTKQELLDRVW
ncbi:MAG: winged helix-turn-helix domain-containing protein, partial [Gammaproteobacteria bacterium]